jgi:hypothetical protein
MSVDILIGQNVRIVRAVTMWVLSNAISLRSIALAIQLTVPTGRQREQSARGLKTAVRLMLRTKTFSPLRIVHERRRIEDVSKIRPR